MILTVGELKKYLQDVPDNAIFGAMTFGDKEIQVYSPKRILLIKSGAHGYDGSLCLINNMGTHWDEEWAKENDSECIGFVDSSDYKLHLK